MTLYTHKPHSRQDLPLDGTAARKSRETASCGDVKSVWICYDAFISWLVLQYLRDFASTNGDVNVRCSSVESSVCFRVLSRRLWLVERITIRCKETSDWMVWDVSDSVPLLVLVINEIYVMSNDCSQSLELFNNNMVVVMALLSLPLFARLQHCRFFPVLLVISTYTSVFRWNRRVKLEEREEQSWKSAANMWMFSQIMIFFFNINLLTCPKLVTAYSCTTPLLLARWILMSLGPLCRKEGNMGLYVHRNH